MFQISFLNFQILLKQSKLTRNVQLLRLAELYWKLFDYDSEMLTKHEIHTRNWTSLMVDFSVTMTVVCVAALGLNFQDLTVSISGNLTVTKHSY